MSINERAKLLRMVWVIGWGLFLLSLFLGQTTASHSLSVTVVLRVKWLHLVKWPLDYLCTGLIYLNLLHWHVHNTATEANKKCNNSCNKHECCGFLDHWFFSRYNISGNIVNIFNQKERTFLVSKLWPLGLKQRKLLCSFNVSSLSLWAHIMLIRAI